MIRKIVIALLIIISYLIQTTYNSAISIGNITPNLLLVLVCVFALLKGKKTGLFIGFFSGLLLDVFYGYSNILGFNALLYMYLGYFSGLFHEIIYTDDIMIPVLFTGINDFLYNTLYYVITFALRNRLNFGIYIKTVIFPEVIYTVFLTVFLYKLYKFLNDILERHEKRKEQGDSYGKGNLGDIS